MIVFMCFVCLEIEYLNYVFKFLKFFIKYMFIFNYFLILKSFYVLFLGDRKCRIGSSIGILLFRIFVD